MASEIANLESEIATLKHAKEQYEEEADKLVQKVGELETVNFEVSSKLSEHESAGNHTHTLSHTHTHTHTHHILEAHNYDVSIRLVAQIEKRFHADKLPHVHMYV